MLDNLQISCTLTASAKIHGVGVDGFCAIQPLLERTFFPDPVVNLSTRRFGFGWGYVFFGWNLVPASNYIGGERCMVRIAVALSFTYCETGGVGRALKCKPEEGL
jgi:hypothetical protein